MGLTRWGIIGREDIAHNFADGLKETTSGTLIAIASRDGTRRQKFGDHYAIAPAKRHANYEAIVADPNIDAIYVSTIHPAHAEVSILALRHGQHSREFEIPAREKSAPYQLVVTGTGLFPAG